MLQAMGDCCLLSWRGTWSLNDLGQNGYWDFWTGAIDHGGTPPPHTCTHALVSTIGYRGAVWIASSSTPAPWLLVSGGAPLLSGGSCVPPDTSYMFPLLQVQKEVH